MAYLKILAGSAPGQVIELTEDQTVLGRHPDCQIVLDNAAVSRHHARILLSHGRHYLEDLRSRNGTYLNNTSIMTRSELKDADEIDICEIVFRFSTEFPTDDDTDRDFVLNDPGSDSHRESASATRIGMPITRDDLEVDPNGSSIVTTLSTDEGEIDSDFRVTVNTEAKLRGMIEMGRALSGILDADEALGKALDCVFRIFPQTDSAFALLLDPQTSDPVVRVVRTRNDQTAPSLSQTIVRKAIAERAAILSEDAQHDARFNSSESLSGTMLRSLMCVPLIDSEKHAMGALHLATHSIAHLFRQDDLDLMVSIAAQTSLAVDNAQLHQARISQRDMQRDLEYATQIQLGFLPKDRPKIEGYEFADFYEAAQSVGGDFFDYVPLPRGRLAFSIADVAGKGVPAALLMARLYSTTRYHLLTQKGVGPALDGLNSELATSGVGHRFVTAILAVLNPTTHLVRIANAGHMPPLWKKADGTIESVGQNSSGLPLGVEPEQHYSQTEITLSAGDSLFLFTDGVTEAANTEEELFGLKRLKETLAEGPSGAEALVRHVLSRVEAFADEDVFKDDLCIVCVHRKA